MILGGFLALTMVATANGIHVNASTPQVNQKSDCKRFALEKLWTKMKVSTINCQVYCKPFV